MFTLSAAGFMATSTSGLSPGVKTSRLEKMQLEAADPGQRPGGSANLGGEVGQGAQVVASQRRLVGELRAGDLHAVAGIAGEADDDGVRVLRPIFAGAVTATGRQKLRIAVRYPPARTVFSLSFSRPAHAAGHRIASGYTCFCILLG